MKHTIHTPTGDFAFLATEFDHDDVLASENIIGEHKALVAVVKGEAGVGLPPKEFNEALDIYLTTRQIPNGADLYSQMSKSQQDIIQCIKRSFARTKDRLVDMEIPSPGKGENGDYSGTD